MRRRIRPRNQKAKQSEVGYHNVLSNIGADDRCIIGVPFRIEYPVDKGIACKRLIAHSFILKTIEAFLGPNFIPTWDSFVFKVQRHGHIRLLNFIWVHRFSRPHIVAVINYRAVPRWRRTHQVAPWRECSECWQQTGDWCRNLFRWSEYPARQLFVRHPWHTKVAWYDGLGDDRSFDERRYVVTAIVEASKRAKSSCDSSC